LESSGLQRVREALEYLSREKGEVLELKPTVQKAACRIFQNEKVVCGAVNPTGGNVKGT
jgi:hypothetical protein